MTTTLAVVFRATQKAGEKLELRDPSMFYGVACVQFVNDCTIGQVCLLTLMAPRGSIKRPVEARKQQRHKIRLAIQRIITLPL